MDAIADDTSSVRTMTPQSGTAANNGVPHICLVPDSPKAPGTFTVVPIDESNSESVIETWKNRKTIYGVFSLYIPGNKLALLIEHAFQGNTAGYVNALQILL